ncbi:ClpX C4-type zinc finger protein [Streptomyces sp. NPDC035033]|uniref:ClpX C4-type zinc finger protein n=1 Tax=Streptomyces sp. NPDC035033 TaxID=3155368 RepID=UPI0033CDF0A0
MAAITEPTGPTHCSFCGKPVTEVGELIAGPGVHICDRCVALAERIVTETLGEPDAERAQIWAAMTDEDLLDRLPHVARHIERAEADLRLWVRELRRRGVTWSRIGETLGITRQSAWERFSGEE